MFQCKIRPGEQWCDNCIKANRTCEGQHPASGIRKAPNRPPLDFLKDVTKRAIKAWDSGKPRKEILDSIYPEDNDESLLNSSQETSHQQTPDLNTSFKFGASSGVPEGSGDFLSPCLPDITSSQYSPLLELDDIDQLLQDPLLLALYDLPDPFIEVSSALVFFFLMCSPPFLSLYVFRSCIPYYDFTLSSVWICIIHV